MLIGVKQPKPIPRIKAPTDTHVKGGESTESAVHFLNNLFNTAKHFFCKTSVMKPYLQLSCAIILAALISSCQKENQAPAAKAPAAALQSASLATTNAAGVSLCRTINLGMIDFYPFHGNAKDVSGHGHDADVFSFGLPPDFSSFPPPVLTKNKYGMANEAYLFDGQSDGIRSGTAFNPAKEIKQFSFYVRFKSNSTGTLLNSGDINDPTAPFFTLRVNSDNSSEFIWGDNLIDDGFISKKINGAGVSIPANRWVDLVVNYSNSILTIYINGAVAGTGATPFSTPAHFNSDLLIGAEIARYPANFYDSSIDEVRIYNRPMTADEMTFLMAH